MTRLFASPEKSRCSQPYLANLDPFAKISSALSEIKLSISINPRPHKHDNPFSYLIGGRDMRPVWITSPLLRQFQAAEQHQQTPCARQYPVRSCVNICAANQPSSATYEVRGRPKPLWDKVAGRLPVKRNSRLSMISCYDQYQPHDSYTFFVNFLVLVLCPATCCFNIAGQPRNKHR